MPKTNVKIKRSKCDIGGDLFALISQAYFGLLNAGREDLAEEMEKKMDAEAESPDDVLKIVEEYVTLV